MCGDLHLDGLLKKWKEQSSDGIKIHRNKSLNTILFVDDQATFATSEDDPQRAIYILHKIGKEYNCHIMTEVILAFIVPYINWFGPKYAYTST